ncbi:MAG: hypothetical protein ACLR0U_12735 [Enterocloster clostridioformis]
MLSSDKRRCVSAAISAAAVAQAHHFHQTLADMSHEAGAVRSAPNNLRERLS